MLVSVRNGPEKNPENSTNVDKHFYSNNVKNTRKQTFKVLHTRRSVTKKTSAVASHNNTRERR